MNEMRATEVLIIESRAAHDYFDGRQEGKTLQSILDLAEVRSKYVEVVNRQMLARALAQASSQAIRYVHFSCHGSVDGIALTDGDLIDWETLDELAWPKLRGKCLTFSSCDVGRGVDRLFSLHRTFCSAIVAPTRQVLWDEALVAYSVFYFRATRNGSTEQDVRLMNCIVGRGSFVVHRASRANATYIIGGESSHPGP